MARRYPAVLGLAGVLLTALGLVPWYNALRDRSSARAMNIQSLAMEEQEARFDYWLKNHRAWFTSVILILLAGCGLSQLWVDLEAAVGAAGLQKDRVAAEPYRLMTAPFIHGHPLHWG